MGVIAISTPYEMPPDPRLKFIRMLQWIMPRVPKGESDWTDPIPESDHIDYPYYPTKSIIELQSLITQMQIALPKIDIPTLLMHSRKDGSVSPDQMEKIFTQLGTRDKEMSWIEEGGHVIVRDIERERVFQTAENFIRRVVGNTQ
jgi:esterase/lipase